MLGKSHFHMINVGSKIPTPRLAIATGMIFVQEKAFFLIKDRQLPKGDPLVLGEIAGIQGAKKTAELIPLCHPLPLDHIEIIFTLEETQHAITATAFVSTTSKTGVEMEAMSAVQAALLTVYDLTKMVNPHLIISHVQLLLKKGGKSGLWLNPEGVPAWVLKKANIAAEQPLSTIASAVVTLSDRASQGVYQDTSGPYLCEALKALGSEVRAYQVLPDEALQIQTTLMQLIDELKPEIIITTGGTGIGPRDRTPEAIAAIAERFLPGIGELLRLYGSQFTPNSWASRSLAAVVKKTLVISLPGSEKAVKEGFACVSPLLPHLVHMCRGQGHG